MTPGRIFLDTNVFMIGAALSASPEAQILRWAGSYHLFTSSFTFC